VVYNDSRAIASLRDRDYVTSRLPRIEQERPEAPPQFVELGATPGEKVLVNDSPNELSAAQIEIDNRWRAPREAASAKVAEFDPMERMIAAQKQMREYERGLPAGSTSTMRVDKGDGNGMVDADQSNDWEKREIGADGRPSGRMVPGRDGHGELDRRTIGEQTEIDIAREKPRAADPKLVQQIVLDKSIKAIMPELQSGDPARAQAALRNLIVTLKKAGIDLSREELEALTPSQQSPSIER
jgi:hypothetical protein